MLRAIIAIALLAGVHGLAAAQGIEIKREGIVTLPDTQELVLHSKTLNRDMQVRIAPPIGQMEPGAKAAAVYLLDGNGVFGLASDTLALMALEGETSPTWLIAIGYDTANGASPMTLRATDYLHSVVKYPDSDQSEGGGGAAFETFVMDELKPFIEARLAVDPAKSIIGGHSYGGLFVSNLIARRPGAFSGYLIGSPSVWADDKLVDAVAATKGSGQPVFVGVGEKEVGPEIDMVTDAARIAGALKSAGFSVTERVHQGQSHVMELNVLLADGLRVLLARPEK